MKRRILASLAVSAALAGGGLAVATLNPLQVVSAESGVATQAPPAATGHEGPLQRALAKLVDEGTLTQQQAGAVRDAVRVEVEEQGGRPGRARLRHAIKGAVKVAADTIGITPEELVAEIRDGKTVAEIAEAHGSSGQAVIDALVAAGEERIDKAVENGKLTEDQAAKARERIEEMAERFVNHRRGETG